MCAPTGWLADHQVTRIGMKSISDYWRSVVYLLRRDSPEHCHRRAVDQLSYRVILEPAARLPTQHISPILDSSPVWAPLERGVRSGDWGHAVTAPAGAASRPHHARDPASLS
jgi:hypothetical protein